MALFKNVDPSRFHPIRALPITEFEQSRLPQNKLVDQGRAAVDGQVVMVDDVRIHVEDEGQVPRQ